MAKVEVDQERVYVLRLNELEASALLAICGHIGGDNDYRHAFTCGQTGIEDQLYAAGVTKPAGVTINGSVYFEV